MLMALAPPHTLAPVGAKNLVSARAYAVPDEVLHLAAALLFAGFKSVIAPMWDIEDGFPSKLSGEFYKQMLGGPRGPKNYSVASIGLARTFSRWKQMDLEVPLAQVANMIHLGV